MAATPEDKAAAESLFLEGRRLMDQKEYAQACPKLEESQRLDPAPGTLLNLAVCHEYAGKLATAWGEFRQALSVAKRDGRADREKLASEHIAAIEPRLPHLVVTVPPDARVPGLVVKRDNSVMGEASWGSSLPVDPGDVTMEAEAPGFKPWRTTVPTKEGATASVTIPKLEAAPKEEAKPVSSAAPVAPAAPSEGRKFAGYGLIGVGAIGLGLGTYFGLTAISKRSDSNANCPNDRCNATGVQLNDDAKHAARAADFGIGLGLVAAAAGAYLLLTPSSSDEGSATVSAHATPLPGGGMASLRGAF